MTGVMAIHSSCPRACYSEQTEFALAALQIRVVGALHNISQPRRPAEVTPHCRHAVTAVSLTSGCVATPDLHPQGWRHPRDSNGDPPRYCDLTTGSSSTRRLAMVPETPPNFSSTPASTTSPPICGGSLEEGGLSHRREPWPRAWVRETPAERKAMVLAACRNPEAATEMNELPQTRVRDLVRSRWT